MFCRSSSHILIWGNCNICFHFLLFPFLFPPPPARRTDLQLRQGGECSKKTKKTTQALRPPPAPAVTWLHHFRRRVEGVFQCREDSNGASSGPWSSSDIVQDHSVASSELQLKLHRRTPQAGCVRHRQRPKSEVRFWSDPGSNRTTELLWIQLHAHRMTGSKPIAHIRMHLLVK